MKYIEITNWNKHQVYKDRLPKWIRLFIEIIERFDAYGKEKKFFKLPDSAKLTFLLLICLRPHYHGNIPFPDTKWLKKRLGIKVLNLQPLIDSKFITIITEPLQEQYRNVTPETETETEIYSLFQTKWNSKETLPKIVSFSDSRRRQLNTRLKDSVFADRWPEVIEKLSVSKFHTGQNERGWRATVDWILHNDKNYLKILELAAPVKKEKKKCSVCNSICGLSATEVSGQNYCSRKCRFEKLGW